MKICTKCEKEKAFKEFNKCSRFKDGFQYNCRECQSNRWIEQTRGEHRKQSKAWSKKRKIEKPYRARASALRSSWLSQKRKRELGFNVPSIADIEGWLKSSSLVCFYTGKELTLDNVGVDHKLPLSRGGTFDIENLAICSRQINTAKGALNEQEFKSLLNLISTWEDCGVRLLGRLRAAGNVFNRG